MTSFQGYAAFLSGILWVACIENVSEGNIAESLIMGALSLGGMLVAVHSGKR